MIAMFATDTAGSDTMSSDKAKPATRQRKSREQKFYSMTYDYARRGKAGFILENAATLAPGEGILRVPRGRRGFPDYPETPRFLFDESRGPLPKDLELCHEYWLVSDRAKSVFEALDRTAFAFAACDIRVPQGDYNGPPYWLCDIIRVLDALDEARSRVTIRIREEERYPDFGKKYYSIAGGGELAFRRDAVGDAHVFRMEYMEYIIICDQTTKDACKAAGLKVIRFNDASNLI
jgi:hypothetical protein